MELAYRARSGRAGQVKDIMPRRPLAHAIIRHLCLALRPLSGHAFRRDGMTILIRDVREHELGAVLELNNAAGRRFWH